MKPTECPIDDGVPTCASGPAGRLGFVLRELLDAIRDRRGGSNRDPKGRS